MAVAPELFEPSHALTALELANNVLRGPLGLKTLDSKDLQYRANYDNANDSDDASVAKGLNYHNVSNLFTTNHPQFVTDCFIRDRNGAGR